MNKESIGQMIPRNVFVIASSRFNEFVKTEILHTKGYQTVIPLEKPLGFDGR
jgi:hypothetical protein